jgi:three-Cys-motif partner protein
MALEFKQDAICLSGLTGSRLKCQVIGQYYPFWWRITSGGPKANYAYPTAIVELDAATGEVYVEDTGETVLGSSGHALSLKLDNPGAQTQSLKVLLVEKDPACYGHLKQVIARRWSGVNLNMAEGPAGSNTTGLYLFNSPLADALQIVSPIRLGNALFFFDPLRSTAYTALEQVARARMDRYYKTGTEIIVFLFTSDWFLGRDDFSSLPSTVNESRWSVAEKATVSEADELLGTNQWRSWVLNSNLIHQKEEALVEYYRQRLHKWFRYVLPMPFNPKANQVFHLILCSNYEIGVRATRDFYCDITGNPRYAPDNDVAYQEFRKLHAEVFSGLTRAKRPLQWRVLWKVISEHEEGIADCMCSDFSDIGHDPSERQSLLEWLEEKHYLRKITNENAWGWKVFKYQLDWSTTAERLQVSIPAVFKPLSLKPLSVEDINR